jgi:hypothetical protein
MTGAVAWGRDDRTGGEVDAVFDALWTEFPEIKIERLTVTHPGDDNNVWYINGTVRDFEIQLDTAPGGQPPFIVESNIEREKPSNAADAIKIIRSWLNFGAEDLS